MFLYIHIIEFGKILLIKPQYVRKSPPPTPPSEMLRKFVQFCHCVLQQPQQLKDVKQISIFSKIFYFSASQGT